MIIPKIISHRGYWIEPLEKNSLKAFIRSFENGCGVELDIRYIDGNLIVSHDHPSGKESLFFKAVIDYWEKYIDDKNTPKIAINIKEDGLRDELQKIISKEYQKYTFVFDMSIPDTIPFMLSDFPFFTRQSEYEPNPNLYDACTGVWLDEFKDSWISGRIIQDHLKNNKSICIVSPELHNRDYLKSWKKYKRIFNKLHNPFNSDIMICTDKVKECKIHFDA